MGIKQLSKVLSENKNVISEFNNGTIFNETIRSVTRGKQKLSRFVFHVDTSLIFYKHLFGGSDMNSVYESVRDGIRDIKSKKNKIIFYSEPTCNRRKGDTHAKRKQTHEQTHVRVAANIETIIQRHVAAKKPIPEKIIEKKVATVIEDIKEEDKLNNQLGIDVPGLDMKFISLLEYKKDAPEKEYETYLSELEYFSNNDIYETPSSTQAPSETEDSFFDIGEEFEPSDTLSSLSLADKTEEDLDDGIEDMKHTYNVIKDRKQLFNGFIMNNSMAYHKRYIMEKLLSENVISTSDIIESEFLDAELNIIKNISDNYIKYNNIIISTDQDCILFGLHYIDKGVFFTKERLSSDPRDLTIVLNTRLSKNVSLITAFFNESDYFKGLPKTTVTPIRMRNFLSLYSEIMEENFNLQELIGIYTKWFVKSYNKMEKNEIRLMTSSVEKYFESFSSFLALEKSFFTNPDINRGLTIEELDLYFLDTNPKLPYIDILGNRVSALYTYEHF